ncbi:DDE-type integrase/transposase/recombinase, partial [Actinosynnema sp.]|uniref:DDE-type integrase/transposase/recombinase n=1 Tax=Actinosynnema sp. TaxID=1872144 RepID=UPI003F869497
YGARRVHAELTLGRGIQVWHGTVEMLMARDGLKGVAGRRRWRRPRPELISRDLVDRQFRREGLDQLWVTDITEHPTREGKVYCAVVLDACSRRVVGWSIDSTPTAALVTSALGMAIDTRRPPPGTVIHSDHGVQGGFNWSSQHLDPGGAAWRRRTGERRPAMFPSACVGSGGLTVRFGRRCVRRAVQSRRGWCSGSSGG